MMMTPLWVAYLYWTSLFSLLLFSFIFLFFFRLAVFFFLASFPALKVGSGCHLWGNFGNSSLPQVSLLGIVSSYQLTTTRLMTMAMG